MADGVVVFDVELDSSGLTSALSGLARNLGLGVIGAEIGSKLGDAAKRGFEASMRTGMSFESTISKLAAVYETDAAGVAQLAAAAKNLGETTKFSAVEAASALVELGQAGLSQADALATIPHVLNLAAAGGIGIAEAAAIATVGMNTMGLNAGQLETLVDQLAVGAAVAATDVASLGEAFSFVGGIGQYLSGGTAEVVAALGLLSNAGIDASTGGIKLRNIITRLIAPTEQAAAQLDALGVSVTDTEGNMRPLPDVFGDIQKSMEGMTEAQKATALSEIFNTEDLAAAKALLSAVGDGWSNIMSAVTNSGGAAGSMAQTMLDNLEGDVTLLRSAGESLGIAFYEGVDNSLRSGANVATDFVQGLVDLANIWNGNESFLPENFELKPLNKSPAEILFGDQEGEKQTFNLFDFFNLNAEAAELPPEVTEASETIAQAAAEATNKAMVEAYQNGEISLEELIAGAFGGGEGSGTEEQIAAIAEQMTAIGAKMKAALIAGFNGGGEMGAEGTDTGTGEGGTATEQLTTLGIALAQAVAEGITTGATSISSELTKAISTAKGDVKLDPFNTLGQQISQGIADGIEAGSGSIATALINAVLEAIGAAEGALGINSPSRVARDRIGRWIPAGAAEGVKLNAWQLRQACFDMANDSVTDVGRYAQKAALESIGRDIRKHALPVSFGWEDARIVRSAAKSMQVEQVNNFNVPVQTPDEFAQTMELFLTYGLEADW